MQASTFTYHQGELSRSVHRLPFETAFANDLSRLRASPRKYIRLRATGSNFGIYSIMKVCEQPQHVSIPGATRVYRPATPKRLGGPSSFLGPWKLNDAKWRVPLALHRARL